MKVFIFHGTKGSPKVNWFPWLKKRLEKKGIEVYVPKFPTPKSQSLNSWLKVFEKYQDKVDEETVFVGHSMGPGFMLRLLEKRKSSILGAVLVAPFDDFIGTEPFDSLNKTFIDHSFDWKKIKKNCQKFVVLSGDNDPYVPLKFPKRMAKSLGIKLGLIKGGGHLNEEAGFLSFLEF